MSHTYEPQTAFSIIGACAFGLWQHSIVAGIWMFFILIVGTEIAAQIGKERA